MSDELFANPVMGWQTFYRFADDDPNLQGLPSASAYFRFLVIRSVEHEARAKVGGTTTVSIQWENAGVAPPYRDYRLAIRLRPGDSKTGPSDYVTDTSIRGWLPKPCQPRLVAGCVFGRRYFQPNWRMGTSSGRFRRTMAV